MIPDLQCQTLICRLDSLARITIECPRKTRLWVSSIPTRLASAFSQQVDVQPGCAPLDELPSGKKFLSMIWTLLQDFCLRRHRHDICLSMMVSNFFGLNIRQLLQLGERSVVVDEADHVCAAEFGPRTKDSDVDIDFHEESEVTSSLS